MIPATETLQNQSRIATSNTITITAKAYEVEWGLDMNTAALLPFSPVACVKNETVNQVRLVPFAAAKLRLEEIPVMKI